MIEYVCCCISRGSGSPMIFAVLDIKRSWSWRAVGPLNISIVDHSLASVDTRGKFQGDNGQKTRSGTSGACPAAFFRSGSIHTGNAVLSKPLHKPANTIFNLRLRIVAQQPARL